MPPTLELQSNSTQDNDDDGILGGGTMMLDSSSESDEDGACAEQSVPRSHRPIERVLSSVEHSKGSSGKPDLAHWCFGECVA